MCGGVIVNEMEMKDRWIYLDNAATTQMRKEAQKGMLNYLCEQYGNPGGMYRLGYESRRAVEEARETIAKTIHADCSEIYFVSGGTEADNLALRGTMESSMISGKHIITSSIEHSAVLNTCKYLKERGCDVTILPVDSKGRLSVDAVRKAIRPSTGLISVMMANNEIGTIQPIEEIGELAKKEGILFHTDAVQAYAQIPIDVRKLNVDLLGVSAHKFYGPKGIGFLYIRRGTKLEPQILGGGQEKGMRSGTENVPGIIGMGEAAKYTCAECVANGEREKKIRDTMIEKIRNEISGCVIDGSMEYRLPNNIHLCFEKIDGEMLVRLLDKDHIAVATGSACSANKKEVSHVLTAIGKNSEQARGSIRITLSKDTTMEDADIAVHYLKKEVDRLRKMS